MKHKRFDHRGWVRVVTDRQVRHDLPGGGVLVDYQAGPVIHPLVRPFRDRSLTLLDSGFRWVYFQPDAAPHALTVMLDAEGGVVQLYVDIALDSGLDPDGWPYITDLYLDVLAVCDEDWRVTETMLKDEDEWREAQRTGDLSIENASLAKVEAERVQAALVAGTFEPLWVVRDYLSRHGAGPKYAP